MAGEPNRKSSSRICHLFMTLLHLKGPGRQYTWILNQKANLCYYFNGKFGSWFNQTKILECSKKHTSLQLINKHKKKKKKKYVLYSSFAESKW